MEQEVPVSSPSPVLIDERALNLIKDTMRQRFIHEQPSPELPILAMEALFDYIAQRGGKPGFEVRVGKRK